MAASLRFILNKTLISQRKLKDFCRPFSKGSLKPSNKLCLIFIFVGIAITAIASVLMSVVSFENGPSNSVAQPPVSRELFPQDFAWGAATAAYQIEGAFLQDGKGLNIWDDFCRKTGTISNNDTGEVACNHYNRIEEDVQLLYDYGIKNYRFSIAWSRIFPSGEDKINQKGIEHYNRLIDLLLSKNITPYITLYHWDLPLQLQQKYGVMQANCHEFCHDNVDTCFQYFGDRVKYWITINEPYVISLFGNGIGNHAPGRCSDRTRCSEGDSNTETYIVAHNLLKSHAKAVDVYRNKYSSQKGKIGITLNSDFAEPITDSNEDKSATDRYLRFLWSWFADPVVKGDYPQVMKERIGNRLPSFTKSEKSLIRGSYDFLGLNHYTSVYAGNDSNPQGIGYEKDRAVKVSRQKNGMNMGSPFVIFELISEGPVADSDWLYVYPQGFRGLLNWIKENYQNPPIYITENGVDAPNESAMTRDQALKDDFRVRYLRSYIQEMQKAIEDDDCDVRGYFVWSLMDNFEWADGYSKRFGITYVDYADGLKRFPKNSAIWFKKFIATYNYDNDKKIFVNK